MADDPLAVAFRLHQAGQVEDARKRYEALLKARPQDAAVLRLLGAALCQLNDPDRGRDYLRQSLALAPDHTETWMNLGKVCGRLQRFEEAAQAFAEAARLSPQDPEPPLCQATVASDQGQHRLALGFFSRALELSPTSAQAWRGAALSAMTLGLPDDAIAFYDKALAISPRDYDSLCNRGALRVRKGLLAEALSDYDLALSIDPNNALAWNNQGVVLKDLDRIEEAARSLRRALSLRRDYPDAWSNLGNVQQVLGQAREALSSYDQALALQPGHPDARFNRSMVQMQLGHLAEGQAEYEIRRTRPNHQLPLPAHLLWSGDKPIAGKRLLITMEQGMGDALQFCRYALLARAHGAQVIMQVPQPLMRVIQTLGTDITLVRQGDPLPPFDLACPLMSLPHAFGTELHSIPAPIPYLRSDPALESQWRTRLAQSSATVQAPAGSSSPARALRVGLVWSGGFRQDQPELWAVNRRRNLPLESLACLADTGARFISLQKGADGEEQLQQLKARGWNGPAIEDYTAELGDFADTAALIACLDLVISVDTSTAHLAAALGKPTWILSRLDGCWRWLLDRNDSPWYPTVRLYRQSHYMDWAPVIAQVRDDLQQLVAAQGGRP